MILSVLLGLGLGCGSYTVQTLPSAGTFAFKKGCKQVSEKQAGCIPARCPPISRFFTVTRRCRALPDEVFHVKVTNLGEDAYSMDPRRGDWAFECKKARVSHGGGDDEFGENRSAEGTLARVKNTIERNPCVPGIYIYIYIIDV